MQTFSVDHPSGAQYDVDWYNDGTPPTDDQLGSILADHSGMPPATANSTEADSSPNFDVTGDDDQGQLTTASSHGQIGRSQNVPYAPPLPTTPITPVNPLLRKYSLRPLPGNGTNSTPPPPVSLNQLPGRSSTASSADQNYSGMATDAGHGGNYRRVITNIAKKYGVDPAAVQAIIYQESGGDPTMVNHNNNGTSDYGMMQVNSDTLSPNSYNWRDPVKNIEAGVREFAGYLRHYNGNYHTAFHRYNGFGAPASAYADPVYRDYVRIKALGQTRR